jgi:hypothetical protein
MDHKRPVRWRKGCKYGQIKRGKNLRKITEQVGKMRELGYENTGNW